MKVTIKQIAEMAGVSRGTVDRALNNRPGVKAEVQENIKRIAKEMGYKPNLAAKALAGKRYSEKKIGVLLNSEGNPFFDEVIHGVKAALSTYEEFGLKSIIRTMKGYDVDLQLAYLSELVNEGVNGIVMSPLNAPEIVHRINELAEMNIGVVTINTDVLDSKRLAYVGCRYTKSGTVAAGLMGLMNNGQKERYAIVGSSKKNLAVERRISGITETIRTEFPWIEVTDILENEDSDTVSYTVVKELLSKRKELEGICFAGAGNEGGIEAVLECGKKIKLLTFDLTDAVKRFLKENVVSATICQEPYRQGYEGIEILAKYLIWDQKPEKQLNHTELSIITKYSI